MSDYPIPDYIDLLHKGFDPTGTLTVVVDGKHLQFTLNRRQIMQLAAGCYVTMADMEPGPWRKAHMEAA